MRKYLCVICTAVILIMMSAGAASGDGVLNFPEELKEISEEAFMGNTSLESVVLPDNVTAIGARAFKDSTLKRVTLPDGLETLGKDAFDPEVAVLATPGTKGYAAAVDAGYLLPALSADKAQTAELTANALKRAGFTASAEDTYRFKAEGDADGTLTLCDANGDTLQTASMEEGSCTLDLNMKAGETVFLSFTAETTGSVTFTVSSAKMIEYALETGANELPITAAGEYTFTVPYDGFFTFASENSSEGDDPYVEIVDAQGKLLGVNDNASEDTKEFALDLNLKTGTVCSLSFSGVTSGMLKVNVTVKAVVDGAWGENTFAPDKVLRFTSADEAICSFETENGAGLKMMDQYCQTIKQGDGMLTRDLAAGEEVYLLLTGSETTALKAYAYTQAQAAVGINTLYPINGTAWARFVPGDAGTYRLYSNDSDAASLQVYTEGFELFASDAGSGYGNCFSYTLETDANVVYYLRCTGTEQLLIRSVEESAAYLGTQPLTLYNMSSDKLTFTAPIDNLYRFSAACETASVQCAVYRNGAFIGKDTSVEVSLKEGETVTVEMFCTGTADAASTLTILYKTYETADVMHRALLIGEVNFSTKCKRNEGDVNTMRSLLSSVDDGCYEITKKIDLTKAEVQSAIAVTFADADDNDVSLFFFASHGLVLDKSTTSELYGGMKTYNGDTIKTSELAEWLAAVPGKVIVFIGTCGSGGVIEADTTIENSTSSVYEAQAEAVVEAFESENEEIYVTPETITLPNGIVVIPNRGELRQSKFEVITAATGDESSWGIEGETISTAYNFFVKWIKEGMLTAGSMPADTNKNGSLTTDELYTFVANKAANTPMLSGSKVYYQHPQVYPENSDYVLFTR